MSEKENNQSPKEVIISPEATYTDIIKKSIGLSQKDQIQLRAAYDAGLYDMASVFVWSKTIMTLKYQLGQLGMPFVSELLDRPEIDAYSNYQDISNDDAIRLAEDLGFISSSGAFRLRNAGDIVKHFSSPDMVDVVEEEDSSIQLAEAYMILRTCVEYVLYMKNPVISVDFKSFRDSLMEGLLSKEEDAVQKICDGQYFYKRTGLRIILGLIKTCEGAQLENVLANANIIIPLIWTELSKQEKYQVGRNYADMITSGNSLAASGLKQVLLKVKGFDFVPEDLRSRAFSKAAEAIFDAHFGMNNFFTEPLPVRNLNRMGTVIPISVFSKCLTAVLCVKLGNTYGVSFNAQADASSILDRVSESRWLYYFRDCFMYDERVLYKLQQDSIVPRWINLAKQYKFNSVAEQISNHDIKKLLNVSVAGKNSDVKHFAASLYHSLGYRNA